MSEKQTVCDPRRIELFFEQQLSDEEQATFEEHLSECEKCRRALDARAADAEAWCEARQSLCCDDSRALQPDGLAAASSDDVTEESAFPRRDTPLSMLAPSDDPRMLGRLGTCEIVGVIGHGGMGSLLKGFDSALNRSGGTARAKPWPWFVRSPTPFTSVQGRATQPGGARYTPTAAVGWHALRHEGRGWAAARLTTPIAALWAGHPTVECNPHSPQHSAV